MFIILNVLSISTLWIHIYLPMLTTRLDLMTTGLDLAWSAHGKV